MGGSGATRPSWYQLGDVVEQVSAGPVTLVWRQSQRDDSVRLKDGWVEVGAETASWPTGISQEQSRKQQESRKVIVDLADLV